MTALTDTVDMLRLRHAAVVSVFAPVTEEVEMLAGDALDALSIDPAAADLEAASVPSTRLALDVYVWRWVEARAALGFDFSADGGSYSRSQLAKQATEMRRRAEDAAEAAGLAAFAMPLIGVGTMPLGDEWSDCVSVYRW